MKIDLTQPIFDLEGSPIPKPDGSLPATLGFLAVTALQVQFDDEHKMSAEDKLSRFKIALRLSGQSSADLSVEEVAMIKSVIGKAFGIVIVGRAFALLDP